MSNNLILTAPHLLNYPKYGVKCIYTDLVGNSCNDQEMTYSHSYTIENTFNTYSQYDTTRSDATLINSFSALNNLEPLFEYTCSKDLLFKKAKMDIDSNTYIISPNLIRSGEGFYFKTKFHNVI
jgi:hypothetical protein